MIRFQKTDSTERRCDIMRQEILLCVKANNIQVPGEFVLMLAARDERDLRRMCADLHITIQTATGDTMPVAGGVP